VARKSTEWVQFKLRIRQGLRREIEKAAKKNNRSANNEAVARLEKSFEANAAGQWDTFFQIFIGGGEKADLLRSLAFKMQHDQQLVEEIKGHLVKDVQ
jgi:hypothetical protein